MERATTPRLLTESDIPHTLVVEREEEEAYREAFPAADVLVVEESGLGVTHVRQVMLDAARDRGWERYWQIDDNVRRFGVVRDGKVVRTTALETLSSVERLVRARRLALAGPDFSRRAPRQPKRWRRHGRVVCCILTPTYTGIDYDPAFLCREDTDFCIAHLVAGWETLLVHTATIDKTTGNDGGLASVLDSRADAEEHDNDLLCAKWPRWIYRRKGHGVRAVAKWAQIEPQEEGARA